MTVYLPLLLALLGSDARAESGCELKILRLQVCDTKVYELATGHKFTHIYMPLGRLSVGTITDDAAHEGCSVINSAGANYSVLGDPEELIEKISGYGAKLIIIEMGKEK